VGAREAHGDADHVLHADTTVEQELHRSLAGRLDVDGDFVLCAQAGEVPSLTAVGGSCAYEDHLWGTGRQGHATVRASPSCGTRCCGEHEAVAGEAIEDEVSVEVHPHGSALYGCAIADGADESLVEGELLDLPTIGVYSRDFQQRLLVQVHHSAFQTRFQLRNGSAVEKETYGASVESDGRARVTRVFLDTVQKVSIPTDDDLVGEETIAQAVHSVHHEAKGCFPIAAFRICAASHHDLRSALQRGADRTQGDAAGVQAVHAHVGRDARRDEVLELFV